MQRNVPKSAYEKADSKRNVTAAIKRKSIGFFFKKDETAICLPGKRDTVKVDGKLIQKYILNDSIRVLYKKYNLENPNQNISLALFQRCRPKNVLPVSYASRKVCLCKTHQNFALRLRVLRSQGVQQSPDHSIKKETSESLAVKIDALSNDTVTFQVWKQVVRPYKDTAIKKNTLVEETVPKSKFKEDFLESLDSFIQPSERVRTQYEKLAILKETLTKT